MANKEGEKTKETKKVKEAKEVKKSAPAAQESSGNGKTVAVAVLATTLGCFLLMFVVLMATGVIKFSGMEGGEVGLINDGGSGSGRQPGDDTGKTGGGTGTKTESNIINNPNKRVAVKGTRAEVGDLEFYLPSAFKAGGKNSNGAWTYNLVDDDGWAQVLVYAEKSSMTPTKYLLSKSSVDITDTDYEMNGTTWVEGENGSMLAYATELDGTIYAVIYAVKIDSNATSEAMSMIPKTLYMKKIYKD